MNTARKTARAKIPDVGARLRKVFGRKVISDKAMKEILVRAEGNYYIRRKLSDLCDLCALCG
jgi:hypothetical protein